MRFKKRLVLVLCIVLVMMTATTAFAVTSDITTDTQADQTSVTKTDENETPAATPTPVNDGENGEVQTDQTGTDSGETGTPAAPEEGTQPGDTEEGTQPGDTEETTPPAGDGGDVTIDVPVNTPVKLDVSKSKTAENLDADYQSKVTLSLPSASYKSSVDVVMVIDVSSSMKKNDIAEAKAAATAMCDELASKKNVETKIGIVTFDQTAQNRTTGLVSIDEAKLAIDGITTSSDTNMMAGLIAGKAMLDSGSATEKYLVLMSDGIPIYWVEGGEAVCKMLEKYDKSGTKLLKKEPAGTEPEGSWTYSEGAPQMKSVEELLNADNWADDKNIWKQISDTGEIMNPEEYIYTNIQKSTYMTAKYLQEEILGKYNLKMVAFGTDKYPDNVVYEYGENFCDWIGKQTGVSYYKVPKPGYGGQTGELTTAFKSITNEVIQVVDAGSKVIDVMGKTEDYNFDFINSAEKLQLVVGDETLDIEKIDENSYGFGKKGDDTYRFVLTYYPTGAEINGVSYDECFVWDINEAITIDKKVQLTYSVKLTNPKTAAGTYGVYDADGSNGETALYTNNQAVLYPVDGRGIAYAAEEFGKPTVSYTVNSPYIPPVIPVTPVTPVTPTDPVTPVEPTDPTDPTDPAVPTDPGEVDEPDVDAPSVPVDNQQEPATSVPKTGDTLNLTFWVLVLLATLAALGVCLTYIRKRTE